MKKIKILLIVLPGLFTLTNSYSQTQQPRQGAGQGFNPGQMIEEEKKKVYEKLTTLTADQKEVIEIIYSDYTKSFTDLRAEANGDFQAMRTKMTEVRKQKDDSMKEVLTEEQFKQYTELMEELRQNRRPRGNQ